MTSNIPQSTKAEQQAAYYQQVYDDNPLNGGNVAIEGFGNDG